MERDTIDDFVVGAGCALGAIAAALLVPSVRRRIVDFADERLTNMDAREVAAHAGRAAAKAALSEAGLQAAVKMKEQIFP